MSPGFLLPICYPATASFGAQLPAPTRKWLQVATSHPPPVGCCGEEETFAPTIACSRSFKHNFSQERTQVHLTAEHTSPAREIGTVNGPQTFTSEGTQNGLMGPTAVAQKQGWRGARGGCRPDQRYSQWGQGEAGASDERNQE